MSKKEIENSENKEKSEKKEKKEKKSFNIKKIKDFGLNIGKSYESLQSSIPALVFTCIATFLIMLLFGLTIFLVNVKGPEQVLVPNVVGKNLEDALIEMQVKELYPKINLRYSETPGDKGQILEQSPEAGAIVKGYSRVSLVVSRGVVVDTVGNYVGMNIDDLQIKLQTLFAGQTRPLIVLSDLEYKPDMSDAGTILEQDPPEGTSITEPVAVKLIVSRGPNYENTRRPYVIGQSINDLLQTIARSKIVFDITSHDALEGEIPGTVVSQQQIEDEYIPNYSRVTVEMAMPKKSKDDIAYGIFQQKLAEYPYPVPMRLEAIPEEGDPFTILNFVHPGGNLTIPYSVPQNTTLVLYVVDKITAKKVAY